MDSEKLIKALATLLTPLHELKTEIENCLEILEKPKAKVKHKPKPKKQKEEFVTCRKFCEDTKLCTPAWLAENAYIMELVNDFPVTKKIKNIWYVHPENLLKFFQENTVTFPVISARVEKYLKKKTVKKK